MKASYVAAICIVLVVFVAEAQVSMAVPCSPAQLSSCISAINSASPPTKLCCSKIKEQKPCLCRYLRNPSLKKSTNSFMKIARTCKIPFPKC